MTRAEGFPEAEDFFWAGAQPQMKTKMKDLSVLRALPKAADAEAEILPEVKVETEGVAGTDPSGQR